MPRVQNTIVYWTVCASMKMNIRTPLAIEHDISGRYRILETMDVIFDAWRWLHQYARRLVHNGAEPHNAMQSRGNASSAHAAQ